MTTDSVRGLAAARIEPWLRPILVLIAVAMATAVTVATVQDRLLLLGGAAAGIAGLVVSLRWPVVPLYAFVFFIPLEDSLRFGELGTITRIAGFLFAIGYGVTHFTTISLSVMPLAGWAYIGWATLSMAWAIDPGPAWAALTTLLQMFAIAVLIADVVAHKPTIVRPLFWTYSLSAGLVAILAILAYAVSGFSAGDRVAALADQNVAQFAAVLLPALVFVIHEALHGRRVILSICIAFLTTIAIILSGTRGVWLGAIVVFLLFILPRLRPTQRIAACLLAAFMLVVAFQLPGIADLVTQRTEIAVSTGGAGRTDIWAVGLTIIESSPIAGVGYGNFPAGFTHEAIYASDIGPLAHPGLGRGPHSIVVGTLGELGLIGLVLLACLLVPLMLRKGYGPDADAVQAALVAVLTAALFLDVLGRKQLWLLIGLALGLAFVSRMRKRETSVESGVALPDVQDPVSRSPTS